MSAKRALAFLKKITLIALLVFIVVGALVMVQMLFRPFDAQLAWIEDLMARFNSLTETNLFLGVSVGMITLALLVTVLPLMSRKVNRRQYLVATQRGIIAAVVFFFSQLLYNWAEDLSRFWLIVAIVGVALVTLVIIETLSLLMRQDEEVAFRTDLLAAIASGLASGIVIKLISVMVAA